MRIFRSPKPINMLSRILTFLPCSLLFFCISFSYGQGNNCGNSEPVPLCPLDTLLCVNELSDAIVVSGNDLPDVEFLITDENVTSTSGSGPAIISIIADNQFVPQDVGVDTTTRLSVIPMSYDLLVVQNLLDDILQGTFLPPLDIPCCTFASGLCQDLNNAGIFSGSDFQSLSQLFSLFSSDTSDLFSLIDVIDNLDSINTVLNGGTIPGSCGGGTTLCYAYGESCHFDVLKVLPSIALNNFPPQDNFVVAADSIYSTSDLITAIDVWYLFTSEVILDDGFETSSTRFSIDVLVCQ